MHDFQKNDFEELDSKELDFSAIYWAFSAIYWPFPSNAMAFPFNGRSDEWKSWCNLPPSGGKLQLPFFTMSGRSHLMGVPKNRASMSGKVGAICRPPTIMGVPQIRSLNGNAH